MPRLSFEIVCGKKACGQASDIWDLDAWQPLSILDKKAKSVLEPNSAWSQNLSCFFRLLKPRPLDQQSSLATISLVVQRLHKAIQWINCYPADEC